MPPDIRSTDFTQTTDTTTVAAASDVAAETSSIPNHVSDVGESSGSSNYQHTRTTMKRRWFTAAHLAMHLLRSLRPPETVPAARCRGTHQRCRLGQRLSSRIMERLLASPPITPASGWRSDSTRRRSPTPSQQPRAGKLCRTTTTAALLPDRLARARW